MFESGRCLRAKHFQQHNDDCRANFRVSAKNRCDGINECRVPLVRNLCLRIRDRPSQFRHQHAEDQSDVSSSEVHEPVYPFGLAVEGEKALSYLDSAAQESDQYERLDEAETSDRLLCQEASYNEGRRVEESAALATRVA